MIVVPGYQIEAQFDEDARMLVFLGKAHQQQKTVLIKVLKTDYPTIEDITYLRNEYTLTQNLKCEGIVKAFNLERYQNSWALILEDFGGQTLKQLLASTRLQLREFLSIASTLAETLIELHQVPIIHKDIKPSNIIINTETNQVKITNFSIASCLSVDNQILSQPDWLEGTPAYMSPEQTGRMNRRVDYRSDLYSLGITFYEMLTGTLPFTSSDLMDLIHSHIAKQPISPAQVAEVPQAVSDLVMKLLAKNAEDRYQSAAGLKFDLENCLSRWQTSGKIKYFALGKRDRSLQLFIPQKLYGREREIQTLMDTFERVSHGTTEMMLVSGYSGIGKTSIVNEVHKPIVKARGFFITGKFDQFKRDIPYAGLIQAFRELILRLLKESPQQIALWRQKLLKALGANGQVIIDVLPEVELIIGKQPEVPKMGASEAQNRFYLVFQQFIRVFCQPEHPLVIFLDDLQWVDSASLKLIEILITNDQSQYLLIIDAYRDNEVSPTHSFIQSLQKIQATETVVNQITVGSLSKDNLRELVADTLRGNLDTQRLDVLAELLFSKTQGNPFFATQLLKTLYAEKLLLYQVATNTWQWDIKEIQAIGIADGNVVELIARNISKLPPDTQKVLKLAACLGNQFNLNVLAIVNERSDLVTAQQLWDALQSGLILPLSKTYKVPLLFSDSEAEAFKIHDINVDYKFLHDRVQQAAYSLIPEPEKKITHLKIGQLLLQNTTPDERKDNIFALVNQLNFGTALLATQQEKEELAQLNLIAGQKAKTATAYEATVNYLHVALELLGSDSWQRQYDLTFTIYLEASDAQYLNINFKLAENLCDVALEQAQTLLDRAKLYELKIKLAMAQNQIQLAIDTGIKALKLLEVSLSQSPPQQLNVESLAELPEMSDPYKLAAMPILLLIQTAACFANNPIALPIFYTLVEVSRQYGNSSEGIYGYANYGAIACYLIPDIDLAYKLGQVALKLLNKLNPKEFKAKLSIVIAINIQHWKEHAKQTIEPLHQSISSALEVGDIEFACHGVIFYCEHLFHVGKHLEYVAEQQAYYVEMVDKFQQEHQLYLTQICAQVVLNLLSRSPEKCSLFGKMFNEKQIIPRCQEINNVIVLFNIYCAKCLICYLFKDYFYAVENGKKALEYAGFVRAQMIYVQYNFYYSLALLAEYANANSQADTETHSQQQQYLQQVEENQTRMKYWAQHAPMNYRHKYELVEAEKARVWGQNEKASALYERSINGARDNGYIQEEALANELAGEFHLARERENLGRFHLLESYYCYLRWGAIAKVKDLESRYPQIWTRLSAQKYKDIDVDSITTEVIRERSDKLDLLSVFKASQAISSEIVLDKLLKKLMKILLENSGAEKGLLILLRNDQMRIEASATVGQDEVTVRQSIAIKTSDHLPITVINYVKTTQKNIVLNNATSEGIFTTDSYIITNQTKSILCNPIISQGKLLGILYLENNLTSGAFTSSRLTVLKVLSAQAAISIENALLYEELNSYSHTLEMKIAQRTEALQKLNQELQSLATLDSLTNIANRRSFDEYLRQEWQRMTREQQPLSLILCDVDFFKCYNDYYGHQAGDNCLVQIALAINRTLKRPADLVARYGGEEFAVILPNTNLEGAIHLAEMIREEIKALYIPHATSTLGEWVTCSLGISSLIPHQELKLERLIQETDLALYQAKERGRDCFQVYQDHLGQLERQESELFLVQQMREALSQNRFRLYAQKIAPLLSEDEGHYCEVLLRLIAQNNRVLKPSSFLPLAERYQLMPQIDRWVLQKLLADLAKSHPSTWENYRFAVNLSGATLNDEQFSEFVNQQLQFYDIPSYLLVFEITESVAIANLAKTAQLICDLKALGCSFSLDDFGSGMCSLAYLKQLSVDCLKIDGTFVREIASEPMAQAIVEAITHLGKKVGLKVIAEFVETEEVFRILRSLGIDYAQGYYLAQPTPLEDFWAQNPP